MPASLRTLIERADRFVRSIEDSRREPDRWEGLCTLQALADIAAGRTDRAEARLALAKRRRSCVSALIHRMRRPIAASRRPPELP